MRSRCRQDARSPLFVFVCLVLFLFSFSGAYSRLWQDVTCGAVRLHNPQTFCAVECDETVHVSQRMTVKYTPTSAFKLTHKQAVTWGSANTTKVPATGRWTPLLSQSQCTHNLHWQMDPVNSEGHTHLPFVQVPPLRQGSRQTEVYTQQTPISNEKQHKYLNTTTNNSTKWEIDEKNKQKKLNKLLNYMPKTFATLCKISCFLFH